MATKLPGAEKPQIEALRIFRVQALDEFNRGIIDHLSLSLLIGSNNLHAGYEELSLKQKCYSKASLGILIGAILSAIAGLFMCKVVLALPILILGVTLFKRQNDFIKRMEAHKEAIRMMLLYWYNNQKHFEEQHDGWYRHQDVNRYCKDDHFKYMVIHIERYLKGTANRKSLKAISKLLNDLSKAEVNFEYSRLCEHSQDTNAGEKEC
ncbi:hypothetical protein [Vibrio owensii]|uniref:hypothetical protein n=1 Tax=Vibrio harveyi group TaxID=717610 RepID=UPI003CC57BF0